MRSVITTIFVLSFLIVIGQNNADTITISGHTKLKGIPTCFGENCKSGASCSPMLNNATSSETMVYEDVSIGKIKQGKMICQTTNGICTNTMITVHTAEGVSQAGKQATKQFGEPTYTKEGSFYVYSWKYIPSNEKTLNIRLQVAADRQSAELFVYRFWDL